jgi:hypothetical protein
MGIGVLIFDDWQSNTADVGGLIRHHGLATIALLGFIVVVAFISSKLIRRSGTAAAATASIIILMSYSVAWVVTHPIKGLRRGTLSECQGLAPELP